jgi:3-oxoadipate enol-lactonase
VVPSSFSIAAIKNLLENLSDYFDVLTFDYRCIGESDPVTKDYSMADVSADVIDLLDAFNWDSCLLAGWSFGGIVAQEVAITAPERIQN